MKQLVKKTLGVALLTLVSLGAWADQQVTVTIPDNFKGGKIVEKSQDVVADGNTVVTITVTPADGYQISISDIKVVAAVDPAQTRAEDEESEGEENGSSSGPAIDDKPLTLTYVPADGDDADATDVADKTLPRDYQFTVPSGFGAWVQEANFTEAPEPTPKPEPTKGELSDGVSWSISPVDGSDSKTLTISGAGEATLGDGATPWTSYVNQINKIVFDEKITSISADIFNGFSALTIELKNEDQPVVVTGVWPKGLTVTADVPGHLFNAYQLAESWKSQTIESSTGTEMSGVAFGTENDYATFASSVALRIPSVLKAYVATGIENNEVQISEVTDGIIPANTPVFLYSADLSSDDVRTSSATSDGIAKQSVLAVASTGGMTVGTGEVYILYRDVFYLTQAGTLPAGRVYLPVSALSDTNTTSQARLSLSLSTGSGTDGTTAISTVSAAESAADVWYCLDGRRLNAAPTKKGVYIHNGKKAVVK